MFEKKRSLESIDISHLKSLDSDLVGVMEIK